MANRNYQVATVYSHLGRGSQSVCLGHVDLWVCMWGYDVPSSSYLMWEDAS